MEEIYLQELRCDENYGGGIFLSTDNGASWTQVNTGITNTNISSFAISDENIFAGLWVEEYFYQLIMVQAGKK